LAKDLGIARNTVADAYGQLVAEGWLSARQGSGTVVARREAPAPVSSPAIAAAPKLRYDLSPGSPQVSPSRVPADRDTADPRHFANPSRRGAWNPYRG
jgi:DNA-binding GntR family transcriptional regulator